MDTLRLQVTGMTCAACSARIEKGLGRMSGVGGASVNMATAQAFVQYDPRVTGEADIRRKIEQLGYGAAEQVDSPQKAHESEVRLLRNKLLVAVAVSIPLFWAMLAHLPLLSSSLWVPDLFFHPYLQLGLATVLQFYVGYSFYRGAYQALKQRSANMDALVVLSTSVAYFYSHYKLMRSQGAIPHDQLYFDTIAMILTVVLLGKLLEAKAKGRALKDLNELYGLQIRFVRVARKQGEDWIPAGELRRGEQVVVLAGEWISADGRIVSGAAEIDESLLTGESAPSLRRTGDYAYSGTRCLNGSLRIRAECDAGETRLSRMIAMVEEAQSLKPTIARRADRAAAVFVPAMALCAAATYAGWALAAGAAASEEAMRYALAVLLIACPCALGLAAPVSILIATALAAKRGILFKHGSAMETLAKADRILFDKTGTLTEGKPRLIEARAAGRPHAYLLKMAAAVERHSAHPLAQAIVREAERLRVLAPESADVLEVPGGGMEGRVEGKLVRIGHPGWVLRGEGASEQARAPGTAAVRPGVTVLCMTIDGRFAGELAFSDSLRSEAPEVVRLLERAASIGMVTGDQPEPAQAIARQAGIGDVQAACAPDRKAAIVEEARRAGQVVAFVGDGNNDAAALATADVGVAMGGGAGAAMQTGDVVLTRDRLSGLADAISISRSALRNIKQNIGFAIAYNTAAVPLAAFGYLDPRVACMGMAASSLLVVGNALRLRRAAVFGGRE
ncbi:heavy metal translocating P-type ATPase [Cohnella cellulosilytica]|uniref:P-type Cu(+) transporter n=1 Tax=Cohnella cellulosilytica TaxID=986710 RepID=A0ABW2FB36_9BACL